MSTFKDDLKKYLRENEDNWYIEDEWGHGCTETGFSSSYEIDYDKLVEEIDAFSKTFKKDQ